MFLNCNNANILKSNGSTLYINTDIYSTTTNANRVLTLESTNATGALE